MAATVDSTVRQSPDASSQHRVSTVGNPRLYECTGIAYIIIARGVDYRDSRRHSLAKIILLSFAKTVRTMTLTRCGEHATCSRLEVAPVRSDDALGEKEAPIRPPLAGALHNREQLSGTRARHE